MKSNGGIGGDSCGPLQVYVLPKGLSPGAGPAPAAQFVRSCSEGQGHRTRAKEGSVYMASMQLYNIINL